MSIKDDIEAIAYYIKEGKPINEDKTLLECANDVLDWINSPSCPLVDDEELEED